MFLNRKLGSVAAIWGVSGAIAILAYAIVRMARHTMEGFAYPWGIQHYVVLIPWAIFMAYSEGYRGFQRAFSPRVAARAVYLRDHATMPRLFFAPLFCLSFFHAPRRRRITVVVLMLMIAMIVVLFQYIPQPWRGILDLGVVIGLSWGILATLIYLVKFWNRDEVPFDAEVIETR